MGQTGEFAASSLIARQAARPAVLMVGGNRESVVNGITVRVINVLGKAFTEERDQTVE